MLGALIGAGASLLSGLLGQSSAKKRAEGEKLAIMQANNEAILRTEAMNRNVRMRAAAAAKVPIVTTNKSTQTGNLTAMVADAIKNGFNPLTYLRAGGAGLYGSSSSTSSVTGSTAMDAALAGQQLPQLSAVLPQTQVPGMGEVIGGAINTGVGIWQQERQQAQENDFQMKLVQAQLQGANMRGSNNFGSSLGRSFSVPQTVTSGPMARRGGAELAADPWFPKTGKMDRTVNITDWLSLNRGNEPGGFFEEELGEEGPFGISPGSLANWFSVGDDLIRKGVNIGGFNLQKWVNGPNNPITNFMSGFQPRLNAVNEQFRKRAANSKGTGQFSSQSW